MVRIAVAGVLLVVSLAVGGCAAGDAGGAGRPAAAGAAGPVGSAGAVGSAGRVGSAGTDVSAAGDPDGAGDPGTSGRGAEPAPGATIAAPATTGSAVPAGLTVTVAGTGPDAVAAARDVLIGLGAQVTVVDLATGDPDGSLAEAADARPDLLVAVGTGALDAVDRLSAARLDLPVLVIGAQLPEPTANVTAVVWRGADGRWSDEGADAGIDGTRIAEAVPAGIVTVLAERGALVLTLG